MGKKIIELKNIVKSFDDEVVVNNLNLYINENEFITLVGPSGCGKTTTLRMIGGFETPDSGEIVLNGEVVNNIPAYQRPINRSEEHTSELQSRTHLVCRLLLEKKKKK